MKTGTIVDEKDSRLATNANSFGFSNLANIAKLASGGISPESTSKELESIDINNILGYEIFPTLITLFCLTQSLPMET